METRHGFTDVANRPTITLHLRTAAHHTAFAESFIRGLRRHNLAATVYEDESGEPGDIAVMWGHKCDRIIEAQKAQKRPYLIAEAGYFANPAPRLKFVSLGWNGLNGRADFKNTDSPPDRWLKHGAMLPNWHRAGSHIVIMGQCDGDAATKKIDLKRWYRETARRIKKLEPGAPIVFRPHPSYGGIITGIGALGGPIENALRLARGVVTYNSTAGVDAALAGIPVYAADRGSMAWPIASHKLGHWIKPDRTQWVYDLAYTQWTHAEIESGEAWAHIWSKDNGPATDS